MKKSTYESRARAIHGTKFVEHSQPVESESEYWKKNVKTREDVVTFYGLYYPYYPKELTFALADYFTRIIQGEIPLPDDLNSKKCEDKSWDYKAEIEHQKLVGDIKRTEKRLEKMMEECEDKDYDEYPQSNDASTSEKKQRKHRR